MGQSAILERRRLLDSIRRATSAIREHGEEREYLKMIAKELEDDMSSHKSNMRRMRITLSEEEMLENVYNDARDTKHELYQLISRLTKISDARRSGPRLEFPKFSADALSFRSFQDSFDALTEHLDNNTKVVQYRAAMTGPKKEELLQLLKNMSKYEKLNFIFKLIFGLPKKLAY